MVGACPSWQLWCQGLWPPDAADALVDAPQGGCGTGAPESSSRSREARKKMKDLVTR